MQERRKVLLLAWQLQVRRRWRMRVQGGRRMQVRLELLVRQRRQLRLQGWRRVQVPPRTVQVLRRGVVLLEQEAVAGLNSHTYTCTSDRCHAASCCSVDESLFRG